MQEVYLYEKLDGQNVRCKNCSHYCAISPGKRGICGVRQNLGGTLFALNYSKAVAINIDPVEKKPLFHFLPGTTTLSVATVGCNFSCANCQNYDISQYPKSHDDIPGQEVSPDDLVVMAKNEATPSISYTYVEPTIFSEYALDTMKIAGQNSLKNIWVSNGFMSAESREMIAPYLDADNIDIKSFSDEFYRKNCGARLQPVLDTCIAMKKAGVWLEITTLIIPTLNDDKSNLAAIAQFIAKELGNETPWHVTQFSGAISWKLSHIPNTPANTIRSTYIIGREAGLKYVYSGNIPGMDLENTNCWNCGTLCIQRVGYSVDRRDVNGKCPKCAADLNLISQ
jgi:pyruvate formate lyase activating enzyme